MMGHRSNFTRVAWLVATAALAVALSVLACSSSKDEPAPAPVPDASMPEEAATAPDAGVDTGAPQCPSNDCLPNHLDCNGDAGDGCETNIRADLENCGACGKRCEADGGVPPPHTRPACVDGACVYLCSDDLPYGPMRNCNGADPLVGDPVKGCLNQLACDERNCGACGVVAPIDSTGDHICIGGNPLPACPSGTTNCHAGTCGQQCKDLSHDPQNCGMCGRQCPDSSIPAVTVAALAAKHVVFTCNGPNPDGGLPGCKAICETSALPPAIWKDCNGDLDQTVADPTNPAFNGCELDTFNNKSNCGACGTACNDVCHTKASSVTLEQVCDCPPGLTWCGNACVDTTNDPRHCGSCSGACLGPWDDGHGSPVCVDSQCSYKCNAGFADCNKQLPDGCEVDTQNYPDHCGTCGHRCGADQRCGNGECQLTDCKSPAVK
jgi:hypothetical protein